MQVHIISNNYYSSYDNLKKKKFNKINEIILNSN